MPLPDHHLLDGFSLFDDDSALIIIDEFGGDAFCTGGTSCPPTLSEKLPITVQEYATKTKTADAVQEKKTTFTAKKKRSSAAVVNRAKTQKAPPEDDDEVNPTDGQLYAELMLMGHGRFLGGTATPSFFVPEIRSPGTLHRAKIATAQRKYRRKLLDFHRRSIDVCNDKEPLLCRYPDRSTAAKTRTRVSGRFTSEMKGVFRPVTDIQTY